MVRLGLTNKMFNYAKNKIFELYLIKSFQKQNSNILWGLLKTAPFQFACLPKCTIYSVTPRFCCLKSNHVMNNYNIHYFFLFQFCLIHFLPEFQSIT